MLSWYLTFVHGLLLWCRTVGGSSIAAFDGAASWCRLSTTFISASCYNTVNRTTVSTIPCEMGASSVQPPAITGAGWTSGPYLQVPPDIGPFQYWPVVGSTPVAPVGAANQPECFTAIVTATADSFIITSGAPMTVSSASVVGNDITPTYCRPMGASPATVAVTQQPTKGAVTMSPNGSFVYTPSNLASPQLDSFTYTITCGTLVSVAASNQHPTLYVATRSSMLGSCLHDI